MTSYPNPDADHVVADQSEIVEFLGAPAAYGADVHRIERIDTHGAMVFLAGRRAYKLKRAVHFPYMDFSTLERRRAACAREIELNRRTAPDLYLGTEPVVRKPDGGLAIGGDGETVDWLVVMRRFDQENLCDRMAQAGRLTPDLVQALADEIARFHEAAERLERGDAPGGGADGLLAVLAENESELAERPDLFAPQEVELFNRTARAAHERIAGLLDRRLSEGFVRRCHGDLHLRNICVVDGRPTIFDAIEFNYAIACIDVLYDLSFLLMDLDHRALRGFANQVLNRYLQRREDLEGLAALPLFLSTRAAVRAKVSVSVAATQADRAAACRLCNEACAYFRAARAYLDPAPARLVAIGGLSGTGKTCLARALAPRFGAPPGAIHLRSDVLRKSLHGFDELTPLPARAYGTGTSERVYAELAARARVALAAGRAVILDAVYARPAERSAVESLAAGLGVPFVGIWLEAPEEVMVGRVAGRRADASDATPDVVRRQLSYDLGEITWHRLDATGARDTLAETAERFLVA